MARRVILLNNQIVQITNLEVTQKDVVDFFKSVPEEDIESRFIHALEVGVFCLQRTTLSADAEFHKRQIENLLNEVENKLKLLPGATQNALIEKIGTSDGQVLAPVKSLVDGIYKEGRRRIGEVRTLLQNELDPDSRRSTLGKALSKLQDLLNPKNDDSVQAFLERAVEDVTRHDGALVKTVKKVVKEITDPLKTEVERLATEIRAEEKAEDVRQETPLKGAPYERDVLILLRPWARIAGAQIDHVGPENKPGDIVLKFSAGTALQQAFTVVVEAKDRRDPVGRKTIKDWLDKAMSRWKADAAVYVSHTRTGLAQEIGDWSEGVTAHGPFIACTHEHLITALRFLIVQRRIEEIRAVLPEIDASTILMQIQRIRTALRKVTAIKGKVTDVLNSANYIQTEADGLRDEIQEALTAIERSVNVTKEAPPKKLAARA